MLQFVSSCGMNEEWKLCKVFHIFQQLQLEKIEVVVVVVVVVGASAVRICISFYVNNKRTKETHK